MSAASGPWGGGRWHLHDVTCPLDAVNFPGDRPVAVHGPLNVLAGTDPEYFYNIDLTTQSGTHVQAPHCFLRDGARVGDVPLGRFEGWAHVVDAPRRGTDTTIDDVRAALDGVDLAGRIVVLRTGHMDELAAGAPLDGATRPGLAMEAAQWLVARGVSMVGIDSVGLESRASTCYAVNVFLCESDVLILEGLLGLDALDAALPAWLEAFPLRLGGVEGTPCRAVVRQPARTR